MDNKKEGFDAKGDIQKYMPNLSMMIDLLQPSFGWASINEDWNKKFIQILKERDQLAEQAKLENRELPPLKIRHTVLSLTHGVDMGVESSARFLKFLDGIFENLMNFIEVKDYGLLRKSFHDFLLFDETFLNFAGEMLMLNSILLTKKYKLVSTNFRIVDIGPDIDFVFLRIEDLAIIPVEVVNITLTDEHFKDNSYIEKFLSGKYTDKLNKKNKSGINYALNPVIWAIDSDENHNLLRLINFFEETKFQPNRVSVPFIVSANIIEEKLEFTFSGVYDFYKK
ncbi:MAG: hypothetical protein JNJ40_08645 [Bacteroidia bacterium]|nr:hypothetical protein [Bacteroidia bacterium]